MSEIVNQSSDSADHVINLTQNEINSCFSVERVGLNVLNLIFFQNGQFRISLLMMGKYTHTHTHMLQMVHDSANNSFYSNIHVHMVNFPTQY